MAINKTHAIILHSRKQGETSKILSIFSQNFGKLSVMVKGSRSIKSRYWGVLEVFNYVSIVFYRKETRNLQYVSNAEIINHFPNIHSQLGKMALAAIPCEIIERSEEREHNNPKLFTLLLDTFQALEKEETGLRNIIRSFLVKYLDISGFKPEISKCHECGQQHPDGQVYFGLDKGYFTCQKCGIPNGADVQLSGFAIDTLYWLQSVAVGEAYRANVNARLGKELDSFLLTYLRYHMDNLDTIRSFNFLEELKSNLTNYN